MSIPSQQIGWSQKAKLLWNISKQLEKLTGVIGRNIPTTTTTTTIAPTNCISFVADTTLGGLSFNMTIQSSEDITYTATWGDDTTSEGAIATGGSVDINHEYTGENTAYNVEMCFSDPTKVTMIEFWGND